MQRRTLAFPLALCAACCLSLAWSAVAQVTYHDQFFPANSSLSLIHEEDNGLRIERVAQLESDTPAIAGGAAIEVVVPGRPSSMSADTVDGVVFSLVANKAQFSSGDTLRVRYRIRNRAMGTVLYDFNSTCQFDVQVNGAKGRRLYSFLENQTCSSRPSRITLRPSAETVMTFPPIPLAMKRADTLQIMGQMAGYPLSTVRLSLPYVAAESASEPVYLEGGNARKPVVEFNYDTKMLVIKLDRSQRLSISAFVLTGKKVNKLSCERFLAPGTHLISFNNRKLADGVVIFKVEGDGFSESKTINLAR
jgi:hypothetical protein